HAGPGEMPARAHRLRAGGGPGSLPPGRRVGGAGGRGHRPARHGDPGGLAHLRRARHREGRRMTRFGAVDCGTNSIRMLITDVRRGDDGVLELTELHRVMEIVRLRGGVEATGRLADAALQRVREALTRYAALMAAEGVEAVRMVGTSASRDASNRDEFFAMTRELLADWGAEAQVISGDEEAALSFRGAVDDLHPEEGPFCVIDVGGGSTEVIVGDYDGTVHGALSVPMGSVRLTERFLVDSPPRPAQVEAARRYV